MSSASSGVLGASIATEIWPPTHGPRQWEKQAAQMDWNGQGFLGGFNACVDFPFAPFYREILAANPDTKLILNVRDPEKWYRSVYETIYAYYRPCGLFMFFLS
eukprot:m.282329 g.282329  ORF g.282329 m.282329 type:complete len:103 (-) comp121901_c0_seq1:361-669(-)